MSSTRPFLKWAGGKRQLLGSLDSLFPSELEKGEIKNYFEPFLGSGAVFFHVAQSYPIRSAVLCDINPELILTFKVVQRDVDLILDELMILEKQYMQRVLIDRRKYYYQIREKFNTDLGNINFQAYSKDWATRAAQFIFLNKTCYNGLYRVNSKGEFNVPSGQYIKPNICDFTNIRACHQILSIADIKNAEFNNAVRDLTEDSFIYFDPPYRPISKTSYFRSYDKAGFGDDQQRALHALFKNLDEEGAKVMISNSDPRNNNTGDNFFDELYKDFNITRVKAIRKINSNTTRRGAINEIVIRNYSSYNELTSRPPSV